MKVSVGSFQKIKKQFFTPIFPLPNSIYFICGLIGQYLAIWTNIVYISAIFEKLSSNISKFTQDIENRTDKRHKNTRKNTELGKN